jgi:uncharacterized protein
MASSNDSLLAFPCEFPIKVFGKADLEFQAIALEIIRKHVPSLGEAAVHERYSRDQHYLSLTVTIEATSQEQLDAIYRELSADSRILMVL